MARHYLNYLLISLAAILILYLSVEAWINPDPKGIGHAIAYFALALSLSLLGTILVILSFLSKAKWLTFLRTFFGLLNSLFIIAFISCITNWGMTTNNTISFSFLFCYTGFTGLILLGLTIKQIYKETKTQITT